MRYLIKIIWIINQVWLWVNMSLIKIQKRKLYLVCFFILQMAVIEVINVILYTMKIIEVDQLLIWINILDQYISFQKTQKLIIIMFKDFKDKILMIIWVIKVVVVKVIEVCQDHLRHHNNKITWCSKSNRDSLLLRKRKNLSINNFSFDILNIYFVVN